VASLLRYLSICLQIFNNIYIITIDLFFIHDPSMYHINFIYPCSNFVIIILYNDISNYYFDFQVYLYGGQVTSWKNELGEELLFVSSKVINQLFKHKYMFFCFKMCLINYSCSINFSFPLSIPFNMISVFQKEVIYFFLF
jgi:hypothetical protein